MKEWRDGIEVVENYLRRIHGDEKAHWYVEHAKEIALRLEQIMDDAEEEFVSEDIFEIVVEYGGVIYRGNEKSCFDIWHKIITERLDVGFSGEIKLIKVVAENELPITKRGEN